VVAVWTYGVNVVEEENHGTALNGLSKHSLQPPLTAADLACVYVLVEKIK
jgi:hypothetical protein